MHHRMRPPLPEEGAPRTCASLRWLHFTSWTLIQPTTASWTLSQLECMKASTSLAKRSESTIKSFRFSNAQCNIQEKRTNQVLDWWSMQAWAIQQIDDTTAHLYCTGRYSFEIDLQSKPTISTKKTMETRRGAIIVLMEAMLPFTTRQRNHDRHILESEEKQYLLFFRAEIF